MYNNLIKKRHPQPPHPPPPPQKKPFKNKTKPKKIFEQTYIDSLISTTIISKFSRFTVLKVT